MNCIRARLWFPTIVTGNLHCRPSITLISGDLQIIADVPNRMPIHSNNQTKGRINKKHRFDHIVIWRDVFPAYSIGGSPK